MGKMNATIGAKLKLILSLHHVEIFFYDNRRRCPKTSNLSKIEINVYFYLQGIITC